MNKGILRYMKEDNVVIINLSSSSLSKSFFLCLSLSCLVANRLPCGPSLLIGWPNESTGWRSEDTKREGLEALHWRLLPSVTATKSERLYLPFPMAPPALSKLWRQNSIPSALWLEASKCFPVCWSLSASTTRVVSLYPGHISVNRSFI